MTRARTIKPPGLIKPPPPPAPPPSAERMVIAYGAELADYARTVKRLNAENAELKTALADEKAYSARLRKTIKKKWEALTKLEDKRLALEKRIDQRREPGE